MKLKVFAVTTAVIIAGATGVWAAPVAANGSTAASLTGRDDHAVMLAARSPNRLLELSSMAKNPITIPEFREVDTTPLLHEDYHAMTAHAASDSISDKVSEASKSPKLAEMNPAEETSWLDKVRDKLPKRSTSPRAQRKLLEQAERYYVNLGGHGLPQPYKFGQFFPDPQLSAVADNLAHDGQEGEGLYKINGINNIEPLDPVWFRVANALHDRGLIMWLPSTVRGNVMPANAIKLPTLADLKPKWLEKMQAKPVPRPLSPEAQLKLLKQAENYYVKLGGHGIPAPYRFGDKFPKRLPDVAG